MNTIGILLILFGVVNGILAGVYWHKDECDSYKNEPYSLLIDSFAMGVFMGFGSIVLFPIAILFWIWMLILTIIGPCKCCKKQ